MHGYLDSSKEETVYNTRVGKVYILIAGLGGEVASTQLSVLLNNTELKQWFSRGIRQSSECT